MDVLVDLSETKVSPKKQFAATRSVHTSTKENQPPPKLIKQSCATGILIDFSDPVSQPIGEKDALNRTDDQSTSSDYSKTLDQGNVSESQLIYLEATPLDISPQSTAMNGEHSSYPPSLSPLNAHQMAELFEQANTIAVRIELANARQCTRSASGSSEASLLLVGDVKSIQFSPEDISDERLKAATSTPAKNVIPDVNAHFWGAELGKSLRQEVDGNARVSEERPTTKKQIRPLGRTTSMKQCPVVTNQGKTLIRRAPSQRTAKDGAPASIRTLVAPKTKTDSLHDSRNSTASSSASDSNVSLKAPKSRVSELRLRGSTQPKNDADRRTSEALTRSLGSPSVPTGRLGIRRPMGSTEMLAEKKKVLLLKPSRNLPLRPPGRSDKKEAGVEHGTNRPTAVKTLQRKQSIPRKVGNLTTAAGKSENQSKKL